MNCPVLLVGITSYIQKLLTNRAVYGELQLNLQRDGKLTAHDTVPDYYPPIMTKEEWLLTTSIREKRRSRGGCSKGKKLSNLFSGILKCGYCGGSMNMGANTKKCADGRTVSKRYIACSNARRGMGCHFIQWDYADFEKQVLEFCGSVDFSNVLEASKNTDNDFDIARKHLASINDEMINKQNRLNNLVNALASGDDNNAPVSILNLIKELENTIEALKLTQQLAEKEVAKLSNENALRAFQETTIIEIINALKNLKDTELHDLRIRLSETLRRSINSFSVYAGGIWYDNSEVKFIAEALTNIDGYSKTRIDEFIKTYDLKPNIKNRILHMNLKNGEIRTICGGIVLFRKPRPEAIPKPKSNAKTKSKAKPPH